MVKNKEVRKCELCGQVIEVLNDAGIPIVCCGEVMGRLEEKTQDSSTEKHVPFIEELSENQIKVRIGENDNHPMTKEHYIQFIEVVTKTQVLRTELNPDDKPEAVFNVAKTEVIEVREYCNLHGLWINK